MPANFDVIVCGSLHLDIVVHAPSLPRLDETAVGRKWEKICGGKGGNQAVQAASAGAKTAMIGRVGKDEFGDTLKHNLARAGLDVSCVDVDGQQGSGMSVAILQDDGSYGAVIVSGANMTIDPLRLDGQWQKISGAKVLVLQNEVPETVNMSAARTAQLNNAMVLLNAAPARDMSPEFLNLVDVLIINRVEAEAMAATSLPDRRAACRVISSLVSPKRSVIITLGGDGLVIGQHPSDVVEIEAKPVRVTSTHGAGDCFVGTLAAQLASGNSLLAACRAANERAAAYVSRET